MMSGYATITMAASSTASGIVPVRSDSKISSSSFGSALIHLRPARPAVQRYVGATRAALPTVQDSNTARRGVLVGLIAVGAAIVTTGSTFSATGPGGAGAQRTNEKAGELLKTADDLTKNESPTRFGPGREGNPPEGGQVAEKAGAGAAEVQGAARAGDGGPDILEEAKKNFSNIFSMGNKTGELSASVLTDPAGKAASDIDLTKGKVKSDISTTSDKAKSLSSKGTDLFGKANGEKGKAGSFVADAKSNTESASNAGKEFFGNLVSKVQANVTP